MTGLGRFSFPVQNGVPALKVHDNIVSQPLGQALAASALGPVSVQGNQLTSRGVVLRSDPALPTFQDATVLIFNLGLSNEAYWQLLAFSAVKNGQITTKTAPSISNDEVVMVQPGLDDARIGQYLANGNVLFVDNQCVLDLLERGTSLAYASVTILSPYDIGFHSNQCDCNLFDDFVISQALHGISLRVSDNRFKEGINHALYSAVTFGVLNTTTDNQSKHCLLIRGWPDLPVNQPNLVLLAGGGNPEFCGRYGQLVPTFGQRGVIANA